MTRTAEILTIPEVAGLDSCEGSLRIPPEQDVPLTPRVRRLIDTTPFRRLAKISQLGLVSLVYPAAIHTRFEHSLGVYRLALLLLRRLAYDARFTEIIRREEAELLIVSALLHDIGHWAFCHPMEDMQLPQVPCHEHFARTFLLQDEITSCLERDWKISPRAVLSLLNKRFPEEFPLEKRILPLLSSILSGPLDIDKIDYLFRDSLHAGVPYGRHFDLNRLVGSFTLNESGDALAISAKGKTAAELLVFSRYVMFSEVYWHRTVRGATAMLQRAVFRLREHIFDDQNLHATEATFIENLFALSQNTSVAPLVDGIFGKKRLLYKQVAQYYSHDNPEIYRALSGRRYRELTAISERLAASLSIPAESLLCDAPPVEKEVEFRIDVYSPKLHQYRHLEDVSPVTRALAHEQFDDCVKCVRVFAEPSLVPSLRARRDLAKLILDAVVE